MNDEHRESYFKYLYKQVSDKRSRSYVHLSNLLHTIPFTWTVANDDNRLLDAQELYQAYCEHHKLNSIDQESETSVFEVIIGILNRMVYIMYGETRGVSMHGLYSEILENLGLGEYSDDMFFDERNKLLIARDVRTKIRKMIKRRYSRSGQKGCMFPLKRVGGRSRIDLRKTELWYQMMYYLEENYP